MIHSKNVLNGGANDAEVDRLWRKENGLDGLERKSSGRSGGGSMRRENSRNPESQGTDVRRHDSQRHEMVERQGSQLGRTGTNRGRMSQSQRPGAKRTQTQEHMARDGYGLPQRTPSSRPQAQAQGASYSPPSPQTSQSSRRFQGF